MLDHYAFQLKVLENSVCETLRAQCMDESSPFYGALEETVQGVTGPHASIALARRLIEGCCVPGNTFCGREDLLERAALAMEYALTRVHEDGTIDLVTTNFHDASETAFAVQTAGPALMLLREFGPGGTAQEKLDALMQSFIDRAADGLLAGGFHTPNHRWVHAAALALYRQGLSDGMIARQLGVSSVGVMNWRHRNGLPPTHEQSRKTSAPGARGSGRF